MFKKNLTIMILVTSLISINIYSDTTPTIQEDETQAKYDETKFPEEGIPIKLLVPLKTEQKSPEEEENIAGPPKEEIPINLLLPLEAREEGILKDKELEERDRSLQYQIKIPTKMSLLPAKNYSMEMLGNILREVFQINLDNPAEQAKMKTIKKLFEQLDIFLEKAKTKVQQRDFGRPISVYGILDVANISKYLSQIDPSNPPVVLESDLYYIRYKIDNLERFLEELKRLITKKEDETKSAKVALFPYPSFYTKSIKSNEKLTQETANELTRRIKGLATTIKEENIDYARKMLVRFLGNYGLIIWAPEGSDMESVQFAVYNSEKVDPKFTENYINTLDKKALKEYMILLIDQLTKNKPELFEELIKFKEDLK